MERNSLKLEWGPPETPNAPIDFYQVRYEMTDFNNRLDTNEFASVTTTTLIENLKFYADYRITVRACTQLEEHAPLCGEHWASVHKKTGVGSKLLFYIVHASLQY